MQKDTNEILSNIEREIRRHCCLRIPEYYTVNTLWPAMTFFIRYAKDITVFRQFPMLGFLSPEPDSGKTRSNKVTAKLSYNAIDTGVYSSANLLYKVDEAVKDGRFPITTSQEELDKSLTHGQDNAQLIQFYNTGWEYDAVIGRLKRFGEGENKTPSGCPKIFDGLHAARIPEDTRTRSLILMLRPWTEDEQPRPLDDIDDDALATLNAEILAWSEQPDVYKALKGVTFGDEVKFLINRKFKIWRPLLAVAKIAGDEWYNRALQAAKFLSDGQAQEELPGHKVLLGQFREFVSDQSESRPAGRHKDRIHSAELLAALGLPRWFDETHLSRALSGYSLPGKPPIKPRQMKINGTNLNGYDYHLSFEAWKIFLSTKEIDGIFKEKEVSQPMKLEILNQIGLVDKVDGVDVIKDREVANSNIDEEKTYNNIYKNTGSAPIPGETLNPSTPVYLSTLSRNQPDYSKTERDKILEDILNS